MKHVKATALHRQERTLFYLAVTFVVATISLYMYFLCVSVVHVVARTETDREISKVERHITDLEARYIEAQGVITIEKASENGFVATKDKVYIKRGADTLTLSKNYES